MSIEIFAEARKAASAASQCCLVEIVDDEIGNLAAAALPDCFLKEVGALVCNKAVADAWECLQAWGMALDVEVGEAFQYWQKPGREDERGE